MMVYMTNLFSGIPEPSFMAYASCMRTVAVSRNDPVTAVH